MKTFPPIIGLSGYAQSGKDTLGGILVERYEYRRMGFADALRYLLLLLDPLVAVENPERFDELTGVAEWVVDSVRDVVATQGWEWAKANSDARVYLQRLGQGVRDVLGPDAWVTALDRNRAPGVPIVITDVRYPNEVEYVRAHGGEVWRLNRAGNDAVNRHESETAIDDIKFDRTFSLPNASSPNETEQMFALLLEQL